MLQNDEVLAQLDRILSSVVFANAARSKQFLEYCVNCSLGDDQSRLKETSIAVDVFLREASYSPKDDPIVRVHARRVREKLALYYRTAGRADPIKINLPKGSYVTHFERSTVKFEPTFALPAPLPVSIVETQAPAAVPPKAAAVPTRPRRLLVSAVVLALICVAVTAMRFLGYHSSHAMTLTALRPVSDLPLGTIHAAWSHDGRAVAFEWVREGDERPYIYINSLRDGGAPRRLTHGAQPEHRPVWSPDNRQIAFIRMLDDVHFSIVRMDISSGKEEITRPFTTYFPLTMDVPTLDWSPDGNNLLTAGQLSPDTPMRLILVHTPDGVRTYLTSPPINSSGDIEGKFSPDGRLIAFRRGGLGDLYTVGIEGELNQKAVPLTTDNRGVRGIAFTPDGKNVLFGSQRNSNETLSICSVPVKGGPVVPVTPSGFEALSPSFVRGDIFALRHVETTMQMVEISRNASNGVPILPSSTVDESASYAPDGSAIVFISTRSGAKEIWLYRRGGKPMQITHFNGEGFISTPHWSPNRRLIAFDFRLHGATNIMIYDTQTGSIRSLTHLQSRNYNPVFSSEGRYIFFSSNEDGTPRIWRIAVDGAHPAEPLFTQGIAIPSSDGKWIYYLNNGAPLQVDRASLLDGTTQHIYRRDARPAFSNSLVVTNEGIYIAVSHPADAEIFIERIDPQSFKATTAWKLSADTDVEGLAHHGFDVSPDGSLLLTTRMTNHVGFYLASIK